MGKIYIFSRLFISVEMKSVLDTSLADKGRTKDKTEMRCSQLVFITNHKSDDIKNLTGNIYN